MGWSVRAAGGVLGSASYALRFAKSADPNTPPTAVHALPCQGSKPSPLRSLKSRIETGFFAQNTPKPFRPWGLRQGADFAKRSAYEAPCLSPHGLRQSWGLTHSAGPAVECRRTRPRAAVGGVLGPTSYALRFAKSVVPNTPPTAIYDLRLHRAASLAKPGPVKGHLNPLQFHTLCPPYAHSSKLP